MARTERVVVPTGADAAVAEVSLLVNVESVGARVETGDPVLDLAAAATLHGERHHARDARLDGRRKLLGGRLALW